MVASHIGCHYQTRQFFLTSHLTRQLKLRVSLDIIILEGNMKFSVDDKGNEAIFYEKMKDGTWEKGACLDREAGPNADEYTWDNWSGEELEKWAKENGYKDEFLKAKKL